MRLLRKLISKRAEMKRPVAAPLAVAVAPQDIPESAIEVNLLLAHQKHDEALRMLARLEPSPRHFLLKGVALREGGNLNAAVAEWEKAATLAPENDEIGFHLLCGLYELHRTSTPQYTALLARLSIAQEKLELRGNAITADNLAASLQRYGAAILRGALNPADARERNRIMQENMDKSEATLSAHIPDFQRNATLPVWFACTPKSGDNFIARLDEGFKTGDWANERLCSDSNRKDLTLLINRILTPKLRPGVDVYMGRDNYTLACDRSMSRFYAGANNYFGIHQDVRLQKVHRDFVNFWIPFTDCGVDASALGFVPIRLFNYFPTDAGVATDIRRDVVPRQVLLTPVYQPGDVLVITSFTLHASYTAAHMEKTRTSVDLRLI